MATRRSARNTRRALADASAPGSSRRAAADDAGGTSTPRRSSRRRRGGGDDGAPTSGPKPAIGRDGKAGISCPNCAARYKIAEEALESKVTCTQCHRTFFPLAAAGSRRKPVDNSKPIIYGIVGLAGIILVGVIINQVSKPVDAPPKKNDEKVVILTDGTTAEVKAVKKWATAIGNKDEFNAGFHTDFDAMQKLLDIDKKNKHSRAFGPARTELEKKVLTALFGADQTLVFRAYKPSYGRIKDEEMVAKKAGRVLLSLYPRDSKVHADTAEVEVEYGWDPTDKRFKVTAWHVMKMASVDYLAEKVDKKNPRKKHTPHAIIGKTKRRETTFAGKKVEIEEAELVPLPHLESTKPEDRKKIDELIDKMIDIHASGIHFNRADLALQDYGKAAVPRILNKMYETKMVTKDDVLVLNRLCRSLRNLTGWRFGFSPADAKAGSDIGGTEKERVSALKQWYAWWARVYDRDDWQNIDSEDEAEMTTEQIDKKRKDAAEARRKASAERRKKSRGK